MTAKCAKGGVTVRPAASIDELVACQLVRSAVFLGAGEPYEEEFDGNDLLCATHLLARAGRTPVGTMRIRIVQAGSGGVAMWERFAIVPAARGSIRILTALADAALAYSRFKGVATVLGAVEDKRLMRFWGRYGAVLLDMAPAVYNGRHYHWMKIPVQASIQVDVDPGRASQAELSAFMQRSTQPETEALAVG